MGTESGKVRLESHWMTSSTRSVPHLGQVLPHSGLRGRDALHVAAEPGRHHQHLTRDRVDDAEAIGGPRDRQDRHRVTIYDTLRPELEDALGEPAAYRVEQRQQQRLGCHILDPDGLHLADPSVVGGLDTACRRELDITEILPMGASSFLSGAVWYHGSSKRPISTAIVPASVSIQRGIENGTGSRVARTNDGAADGSTEAWATSDEAWDSACAATPSGISRTVDRATAAMDTRSFIANPQTRVTRSLDDTPRRSGRGELAGRLRRRAVPSRIHFGRRTRHAPHLRFGPLSMRSTPVPAWPPPTAALSRCDRHRSPRP